ncbi:MAG: phytanoyl-CoA dioxygenase [Gemmatimonadetes bacterium]|nr:MAG: phytanoyl-CoA dioxygenase [Gemmatimonadota bacterium]
MSTVVNRVSTAGFAVLPDLIPLGELADLERILPQVVGDGGVRNLLDVPVMADLADGERLRSAILPILGGGAFPVRAILFDKTPAANWKVSWHQDLTIAVTSRRDVPGYGPWSEKAGVVHVQPPRSVLERMLAIRIHMDESGPSNGPLRVLPCSHQAGKLRDEEIPKWRGRIAEEVCLVPRGGALLMRPLLLHASSPAELSVHRRVVHIEYANCDLAGGLEWRWAKRSGSRRSGTTRTKVPER